MRHKKRQTGIVKNRYICVKENGGVGYNGKGYRKGDILEIELWEEQGEFQTIKKYFRFLGQKTLKPEIIESPEPKMEVHDKKEDVKALKPETGKKKQKKQEDKL